MADMHTCPGCGLEYADEALMEVRAECDALKVLLQQAKNLIENCNVSSGVCCCGDSMDKHTNPMDSGHTPVDFGEYTAHSLLIDIDAAMAKEKT